MTTKGLDERDRGLGSCLASKDLIAPEEPGPGWPQEDKARATPRVEDPSSWPHDSREPLAAGDVHTRPKKMEKESGARGTPGPGKEKLKAGAAPRSAPGRKKTQSAPPPQPPPPPPALSEELPWGDMSLNKCLVLASLVALLGSAFQLCRDAVAGEAAIPAPVPEPWVPPSSPHKRPMSALPKPAVGPPAPKVGPPTRQAEAEHRPEVPESPEAIEDAQRAPGEAPGETAHADRGPQERPQKEKARKERPQEEKLRKEPRRQERPRKERPPKEQRPRAARELREALPRRWEAREGGHRPRSRDSGDSRLRKRPAWASPRRQEEEAQPLGRQKHRAGKGRD